MGFVDEVAAGDAQELRAFKTGVVTAFSSGLITATIDDVTVTGIHRISTYTTPAAGNVVLFAVSRTTAKSIEYVALGVIT